MFTRLSRRTCLAVLLIWYLCFLTHSNGFIKLVFLGNTTACDTCDGIETYSGRNTLCCLAQSKCCGPASFEEEDRIKEEEAAKKKQAEGGNTASSDGAFGEFK